MKAIKLNQKMRQHYRATANGWRPKRAWPSESAARIQAARLVGYNAYLCPQCSGWHIGRGQNA